MRFLLLVQQIGPPGTSSHGSLSNQVALNIQPTVFLPFPIHSKALFQAQPDSQASSQTTSRALQPYVHVYPVTCSTIVHEAQVWTWTASLETINCTN